jgi:hypothetical protein
MTEQNAIPLIYFVQTCGSNPEHGHTEWRSMWAGFDPAAAAQMATGGAQESAQLWVDGANVTDETVTLARVRTSDEILLEDGVDAFVVALQQVRVQLQQRLDEFRPS